MRKHECAALYAAVSVDERKTGRRGEYDSPEAQLDEVRAYARRKGYLFSADTEFVDRGQSGLTGRGKARAKMFERAANGEFDVIIASRMDRLSRNAEEQLYLIPRMLEKWSVRLEFTDDSWDLKGDRLVTQIRAAINEDKSLKTRELLRKKFRMRVTERGLHNGTAPMGYRNENKKLVIEPQEAAVVRHIFKWFVESGSIAYVKDKAFEHGLRKRGRSHQHIGEWIPLGRHCIESVLTNRIHIGEVRYKGSWYPGAHEPLIERETFEEAHLLYQESSGLRRKSDRRDSLGLVLLGYVWCGETKVPSEGYPFEPMRSGGTWKTRKDGTSYQILSYRRWSNIDKQTRQSEVVVDGTEPTFSGINAKRLETAVVEQIADLAEDDERWERIIEHSREESRQALQALALRKAEIESQRQATEQSITQLHAAIDKLVFAQDVELVARQFNEKLRNAEDEHVQCEVFLQHCEDLEAWYRAVPDKVSQARAGYLRAVEYGRNGQRRALQTALRKILQHPYGVIVYNNRIVINLRFSMQLEEMAKRFEQMEIQCRRGDSNPHEVALTRS